MWTEVYFSQNADKVKALVKTLEEADIISRVRCINDGDGVSKQCYKVLVPMTELEEAQGIIVESDLF